MRYVYIVASSGNDINHGCNFNHMAATMLRSLWKHNRNCTLLCNWRGHTDAIKELVWANFQAGVRFWDIPDVHWDRLPVFCKVSGLLSMPLRQGDEIVVVDVDTYIQGDLFEAFDHDFDIGYTSRPTFKPRYPINTGLVAYRWSDRVEAFVRSWCQEMIKPQWGPYIQFCAKYGRPAGQGWLKEQDFLCSAVWHRSHPFGDVKLRDIGPQYNWYPPYDTEGSLEVAWDMIRCQLGSYTKMIHFKGCLKALMERLPWN